MTGSDLKLKQIAELRSFSQRAELPVCPLRL
jgi:hypothetical protein